MGGLKEITKKLKEEVNLGEQTTVVSSFHLEHIARLTIHCNGVLPLFSLRRPLSHGSSSN